MYRRVTTFSPSYKNGLFQDPPTVYNYYYYSQTQTPTNKHQKPQKLGKTNKTKTKKKKLKRVADRVSEHQGILSWIQITAFPENSPTFNNSDLFTILNSLLVSRSPPSLPLLLWNSCRVKNLFFILHSYSFCVFLVDLWSGFLLLWWICFCFGFFFSCSGLLNIFFTKNLWSVCVLDLLTCEKNSWNWLIRSIFVYCHSVLLCFDTENFGL